MRTILLILVPLILLAVCAFLLEIAPLPFGLPSAGTRGRHLVAALTTGVLGLVYTVGFFIYLISSVTSVGRTLDGQLVPLGFTSQNYLLFGAQYQGVLRGRSMEVNYMPGRSPGPNVMNIYVSVRARSKIAIVHQQPLLDCQDCLSIKLDSPELSRLLIYTQDEGWTRRLLSETNNKRALNRLMDDPASGGLREIYLQPNRIWFRAHMPQGLAVPQSWFDDLVTMADGVETIP